MDRGKQRADSPPPPRPAYSGGLEAYLNFNALSVGGGEGSSASARQMELQQRYAMPNSPLVMPLPPPSQPQDGGGVVGRRRRTPHPLLLQVQRELLRGMQQAQQNYCVGEGSSSSGAHFWPTGNGGVSPTAAAHAPTGDYGLPPAADPVMPFGGISSEYVSRFGMGYANPFDAAAASAAATAPAMPRPPVAPRSGTLRASASQYQPIGAASRSSTGRYNPLGSSSSNHPRFSEQVYHENRNVVDALRANEAGISWRCTPRIKEGRSPEEIRSEMLRGPMPLALVFFQSSAAHVIRLLEEGAEKGVDLYRLSALAAIKTQVHRVMEDKEGSQVFIALMNACAERKDEIHAIVAAATGPPVVGNVNVNGVPKTSHLLHLTRQEYGESSLKALITAAAPFSDMCKLLVDCFMCESVMDHPRGDRILRCCFELMSYGDTKIMIQFACYHSSKLLHSSPGSRCISECFESARGEELEQLEHIVLVNAATIARGNYSNYFIQRVLVKGSEGLKHKLVSALMTDVASLSRQQFGSYVVEACFLTTGSVELLHLVLSTFLKLPDDQLADVVQCGYGNYVIQKLVDASKEPFRNETMMLARRIQRLPEEVLDRMSAKQVLKFLRRLFPSRNRLH
ncbi:pumilio homolog 2-like [Oryza brachyantha]|uniref:pumilio homolog 2-like n=1 Tax=Oryza brachyantha TaxID=4533 RepID=UPI001ADA3071|nr:pumilio homolog 2-like [Oryza brachyantha]